MVAAGETIIFPAALRRMVAARPLGSAEALPRAALTGREEEALRLMATGLSNPEIAQSLTVSLETVKTHVGNVLTKLGAQNRTHAVVIAYESGLVVPGFSGRPGDPFDSELRTQTAAPLSGAVATPVLGRRGVDPHRTDEPILALPTIVVAGSALTVLPLPLPLPLPFAWLLVGRTAQGAGLGLTVLMTGMASDHPPEEYSATIDASAKGVQ